MKSQELIQQLLKAEKQAEALISKARDNRVTKLKEAKSSADQELDAFRKKEEEKFQAEYSNLAGGRDDTAEMAKVTQQELGMVKQDYENNKAKVREHILGKILDVPLEVSSALAGAIQRGVM